jgi:hypothetical protein
METESSEEEIDSIFDSIYDNKGEIVAEKSSNDSKDDTSSLTTTKQKTKETTIQPNSPIISDNKERLDSNHDSIETSIYESTYDIIEPGTYTAENHLNFIYSSAEKKVISHHHH